MDTDEDEMNPDINDEILVKSQELNEPDTSMLKSYEDYVQYSLINNMPLNKDELRAIRLVSTLRATAASLEIGKGQKKFGGWPEEAIKEHALLRLHHRGEWRGSHRCVGHGYRLQQRLNYNRRN